MERSAASSKLLLPLVLLAVGGLASPRAVAQDPAPAPTPAPAAAAQEQLSPLEALKKATPEELPKALRAFVEDQISSNALFAGQYAALKSVTGCEALIHEWISRPPSGTSRTPFRTACVRATRDLTEKASEELAAKLNKIAAASYEAADLRKECAYALAQFGQRQIVEARLAEIEKATQSEEATQRAIGFQELADVRYNLREFPAAAAAHESFLAIIEGGKFPIDPAAQPTLFYNAACSHALAGDKEKALARLTNALDAWKKEGAIPRRLIETDMDLRSLREDAKFKELLATYLAPSKKAEPAKDAAGSTGAGPGKGDGGGR
ncbi:MAG: hypothetical protein JNM84_03780 [Planctomycetes bacterium]|nr:hypothetical protein [Planctomycetota bacterium]